MAPGSIFHHINLPPTCYFCRRLFCNLYFSIYTTKIPKIFILLSLSDLTFASGHEGIDNPFIALVARFLIVCAGTRDLRVVSHWIDSLVVKNWGKYLRYFASSPFPLQGKTNACSRGSKKDFWHRCRGGLRKVKSRFGLPTTSHFWRRCRGVYAKVYIPSTHHKPLSPALHYFPFASRFPLPHLTFAVLFVLFPFVSFCLFLVCPCVSPFVSPSWRILYLFLCLPILKFFTSNKDKEKT